MAVGQALHQPHHLVAEIAVDAGSGGGQALGDVGLALGDEGAQHVEGRLAHGHEALAGGNVAVDAGLAALDLEDDVGIEPDHRVAAAGGAVLHAFEQEGVLPPFGELQIGADGRLEVGDHALEDDLGAPGVVALGEAVEALVRHRITASLWWSAASACAGTRRRARSAATARR